MGFKDELQESREESNESQEFQTEKDWTEGRLAETNEENNPETKKKGLPINSLILFIFAGVYLLHTGYKLTSNAIHKVEGAGPVILIAGIAFLGIGAFLLGYGSYYAWQYYHNKKDK